MPLERLHGLPTVNKELPAWRLVADMNTVFQASGLHLAEATAPCSCRGR